MRKATNLEDLLMECLTKLKLKYRREFKIENYPVDIFIPLYKLSIQVDGKYHHGSCSKCLNKKFKAHRSSIFQQQRDNACVLYHKIHKLSIIRLCECEVKDCAFIQQEVLKAIKSIAEGNQYIRTREL